MVSVVDKDARELFDRFNPVEPRKTWEEERETRNAEKVKRALEADSTENIFIRAARELDAARGEAAERYDSWLWEAVTAAAKDDPCLKAGIVPQWDEQERINRVLCRMLERMWHEMLWSNSGRAAQVKVLGELKEYVKK
jgi:hypothetical protein